MDAETDYITGWAAPAAQLHIAAGRPARALLPGTLHARKEAAMSQPMHVMKVMRD